MEQQAGTVDTAFFDIYREELHKAMAAHPEEYMLSVPADTVADRMIEAFKNRSYNHEGRAIKATCKRLGIKHTRSAINAHLAAVGR